ncbi:hypothetical protein C8R45DRAFT_937079 [Mycena sanguinolenta]|nr:hypothetical protein C8R45DRAFT_937079 [Mycena sanguinolenta]
MSNIDKELAWHYDRIALLKARRNPLAPIRRLPNELMIRIFTIFAVESDNSSTNADQLSRSGTTDSIYRSASCFIPSTTNATGVIMGSFIELKTRLSWTKESAKSFLKHSHLNTENVEEEPSELQNVLGRRRQVIAGSSFKFPVQPSPSKKDIRRPLTPTGFVNGVLSVTTTPRRDDHPPLPEGARPSRNPRIVKVGGVGKAE